MFYQAEIEARLQREFKPTFLEILNESERHRGHLNGSKGDGLAETHFNIKMISHLFQDFSRLERHRQVYDILQDLLPNPIHALRLKLLSPNEK